MNQNIASVGRLRSIDRSNHTILVAFCGGEEARQVQQRWMGLDNVRELPQDLCDALETLKKSGVEGVQRQRVVTETGFLVSLEVITWV